MNVMTCLGGARHERERERESKGQTLIAALAIAALLALPAALRAVAICDGTDGSCSRGNVSTAQSQAATINGISAFQSKSAYIPVGTIIVWMHEGMPEDADKWLECDGQAVNSTKYPLLYAMMHNTPKFYDPATNTSRFLRATTSASGAPKLGSAGDDVIATHDVIVPSHIHTVSLTGTGEVSTLVQNGTVDVYQKSSVGGSASDGASSGGSSSGSSGGSSSGNGSSGGSPTVISNENRVDSRNKMNDTAFSAYLCDITGIPEKTSSGFRDYINTDKGYMHFFTYHKVNPVFYNCTKNPIDISVQRSLLMSCGTYNIQTQGRAGFRYYDGHLPTVIRAGGNASDNFGGDSGTKCVDGDKKCYYYIDAETSAECENYSKVNICKDNETGIFFSKGYSNIEYTNLKLSNGETIKAISDYSSAIAIKGNQITGFKYDQVSESVTYEGYVSKGETKTMYDVSMVRSRNSIDGSTIKIPVLKQGSITVDSSVVGTTDPSGPIRATYFGGKETAPKHIYVRYLIRARN